MAVIRLGVATPVANTPTQLAAVLNSHLASVVVANTYNQSSPQCKVDVYVVPEGASNPADYAYICSNLSIGVGQSFETFKVALNPNDAIFVESTIAGTSFSAYGILQSEDVGPGDLPATFTNKTITGNSNVLYVEKNNTATRPTGAQVGYVRFNTDFDALEVLTVAGWKKVATE